MDWVRGLARWLDSNLFFGVANELFRPAFWGRPLNYYGFLEPSTMYWFVRVLTNWPDLNMCFGVIDELLVSSLNFWSSVLVFCSVIYLWFLFWRTPLYYHHFDKLCTMDWLVRGLAKWPNSHPFFGVIHQLLFWSSALVLWFRPFSWWIPLYHDYLNHGRFLVVMFCNLLSFACVWLCLAITLRLLLVVPHTLFLYSPIDRHEGPMFRELATKLKQEEGPSQKQQTPPPEEENQGLTLLVRPTIELKNKELVNLEKDLVKEKREHAKTRRTLTAELEAARSHIELEKSEHAATRKRMTDVVWRVGDLQNGLQIRDYSIVALGQTIRDLRGMQIRSEDTPGGIRETPNQDEEMSTDGAEISEHETARRMSTTELEADLERWKQNRDDALHSLAAAKRQCEDWRNSYGAVKRQYEDFLASYGLRSGSSSSVENGHTSSEECEPLSRRGFAVLKPIPEVRKRKRNTSSGGMYLNPPGKVLKIEKSERHGPNLTQQCHTNPLPNVQRIPKRKADDEGIVPPREYFELAWFLWFSKARSRLARAHHENQLLKELQIRKRKVRDGMDANRYEYRRYPRSAIVSKTKSDLVKKREKNIRVERMGLLGDDWDSDHEIVIDFQDDEHIKLDLKITLGPEGLKLAHTWRDSGIVSSVGSKIPRMKLGDRVVFATFTGDPSDFSSDSSESSDSDNDEDGDEDGDEDDSDDSEEDSEEDWDSDEELDEDLEVELDTNNDSDDSHSDDNHLDNNHSDETHSDDNNSEGSLDESSNVSSNANPNEV